MIINKSSNSNSNSSNDSRSKYSNINIEIPSIIPQSVLTPIEIVISVIIIIANKMNSNKNEKQN